MVSDKGILLPDNAMLFTDNGRLFSQGSKQLKMTDDIFKLSSSFN